MKFIKILRVQLKQMTSYQGLSYVNVISHLKKFVKKVKSEYTV